ncbi:MAG: DUF4407 domain-containing protein [Cyclobacteriaceae bacterium]
MKKLLDLFYWLSDTDEDLLNTPNMPRKAKSRQLTYGIFVFLTMLLAFISGQELAKTFFYEYDGQYVIISTFDSLVSFFLGLLWAAFIGMIDREIVSNKNKQVGLVRIPLAIVIALAVSVPLEMKALKNDIEAHLIQKNNLSNHDVIKTRDDALVSLDIELKRLKDRVDEERQQIAYWSRVMEEENKGLKTSGRSGVMGIGRNYIEAERNLALHEKLKSEYEADYKRAEPAYNKKNLAIHEAYNANFKKGSFGIAARYDALGEMKNGSVAVKEIAIGLMLLLMLLELTPALIKMLSKETAYDQLNAARDLINEQVINTQSNQLIQQINTNPATASNAGQLFGQIKLAITK